MREGEVKKVWFNQMTNDRGRPLDMHSLTIHNKVHPAAREQSPLTVTQIWLPKDQVWATNLGLMSTEELRMLKTALDQHLETLD